MKQAVLYVCHGSRLPKACQEAIEFIESVKPKVNVSIQEISFLELSSPTIEDGFKNCVNKGATHIAVVPLLLLTAAHAKQDIPEEVRHVAKNYPHVKLTYGRPIGVHPNMTDILIDKIKEVTTLSSFSTGIIVGRGSSDSEVVTDLKTIARSLQTNSDLSAVHACFLTAAHPKFESFIEEIYHSDVQSIVIIPYLLFTGVLKREIDTTIKKYDWKNRDISVCAYLAPHPLLIDVFLERVEEAIQNNQEKFSFIGSQSDVTSAY